MNRVFPASSIASRSPTPFARSWLVKSTRRIEFFTSMPMRATKPIAAVKLSVFPVRPSASTPPMMPSGMTEATMAVLLKVRNSSTSTASTPNAATMIAEPRPPKLSWRLSYSPAGTTRYPAGSWRVATFASTARVTLSVLWPGSTSEVTVMLRSLL